MRKALTCSLLAMGAILTGVTIANADLYPGVGTDFTWTGTSTHSFQVEGFVKLTRISPGTNGGPFTLTKLAEPSGGYGTELDWVPDGLRVWCVEDDITFVPGHKYVATIDEVVYSGAIPGQDSVALDDDTKAIYDAYLAGVLPNSSDSLADIRDTIWYEQGLGYSDKIDTDLTGYGAGTYKVLNLWVLAEEGGSYVATDKQSQIVIPAPGAIVLGMMGLGLAGWVRKRIK